jgi:siroheme synthase
MAEKNEKVKLTADTNRQEMPAEVVQEDPAQEDNLRRLQDAKKADYERQVFPSERREDGREVVRLKDENGTVVTASGELAESLKARGYKAAK